MSFVAASASADAGVVLDPERDGATTLEGAVVYVRNAASGHETNQFKGSVVVPRGALVDAIARSIRSSDEKNFVSSSASRAVSFEYGKSLRFVDFDTRVAFFDDVTHQRSTNEKDAFFEMKYDVLVGADGAESVVRASLEREGALTCERNADGLFAKTVVLPPGFFYYDVDRLREKNTSRRTSRDKNGWHRRRHSWPSGLVDAYATPNANGSFDATIVAPMRFWRDVRDARDAERVLESFCRTRFRSALETTLRIRRLNKTRSRFW